MRAFFHVVDESRIVEWISLDGAAAAWWPGRSGGADPYLQPFRCSEALVGMLMTLTLSYFSCQTCHFHLVSSIMPMTLTLSYFSCQTCHFHLVSLIMPMTFPLSYFSCQTCHFHLVSLIMPMTFPLS